MTNPNAKSSTKPDKIRVNITVDSELLEKAKTKLSLFGGKLSTLFNAYLSEFVKTMSKSPIEDASRIDNKLKALEGRLRKLESK